MTIRNALMGAAAGMAVLAGSSAARAQDITVGYILEWPMPFQYARAKGMYDEAVGTEVNWVGFDTGAAMSAAMASGDVHLSVSQDVPSFVVATSARQDMQVLDVTAIYSDNDNCVVREELEIDADSVAELEGKRVAVPLGTAAHYGFVKQMDHFGVDIDTMDLRDMAPRDGAAAIVQGSVDMACGWGGALRRMTEHGNVLLTGTEKEELGILVFDVTSGPNTWVAQNSDLVARFLNVTAEANAMWADPANHAEMLPLIAEGAGMEPEATEATISTFVFPPIDAQLSENWLAGGVQDVMKDMADVFVEAGIIEGALESYADNVNTGPLTSAQDMTGD